MLFTVSLCRESRHISSSQNFLFYYYLKHVYIVFFVTTRYVAARRGVYMYCVLLFDRYIVILNRLKPCFHWVTLALTFSNCILPTQYIYAAGFSRFSQCTSIICQNNINKCKKISGPTTHHGGAGGEEV
jgi:hypothetical protein